MLKVCERNKEAGGEDAGVQDSLWWYINWFWK